MPQAPLPPRPSPLDTAALADTLTFADRVRGDTAWVGRLTQPADAAGSFAAYVSERVLDAGLWVGLAALAFRLAFVALLGYAALRLIERVARGYARRFKDLPVSHPRRQRVTTLTNLLVSAARYVIWPLTLITMLGEVGINVGALLATAGIAGLAIGFGAQTLVRDVISGVFLLFDDSIHVGDAVRIGTDEGTVEHIGVRLIKVRKLNGELMMVPAGELRVFGNRSIDYARALVDVAIPYGQPLAPVLALMQSVTDAWAEAHRAVLLDETPEVLAITSFADANATARIVAKVLPGEQFAAERDLRRGLLDALAESGFDLAPGPRVTLVQPAAAPPDPIALADAAAAPPAAAPPAATSTRDPRAPSDPPSARPPTEI